MKRHANGSTQVFFSTSQTVVDQIPVAEITADCPDGQKIFKAFWGVDTSDQQKRWKLAITEHFTTLN